ncbi:uncharacterized protein LOC131217289 [Magnolia sinica]|uniref:uncharacterized protein LOC131217289 n=1 Tax=Magnolia sinica TaxID=86752 RepID=UPI00265912A9|nr:uncharacterized protein LOC131217289 [Magnolia sinica]
MKDSRCTMDSSEGGSRTYEKNLAEEMSELRKLTTAVMMEKCRSRNEGVVCPKPRRRHVRQCREQNDLKTGPDLSDIIIANKASPPYYSGSPPIRASNPLIQDAHFSEQRASSSILTLCAEGLDSINHKRKTSRGILSMA